MSGAGGSGAAPSRASSPGPSSAVSYSRSVLSSSSASHTPITALFSCEKAVACGAAGADVRRACWVPGQRGA